MPKTTRYPATNTYRYGPMNRPSRSVPFASFAACLPHPFPHIKPTAIPYIGEVLPQMPDLPTVQAGASMDRGKDKVGYEINFKRYFYNYKPLRPLDVIKSDIMQLEEEAEGLLKRILE